MRFHLIGASLLVFVACSESDPDGAAPAAEPAADATAAGGGSAGGGESAPSAEAAAQPATEPASFQLSQVDRPRAEEILAEIDSAEGEQREMALMSLPLSLGHYAQHPEVLTEVVIPAALNYAQDHTFHDTTRGNLLVSLCQLGDPAAGAVPTLVEMLDEPYARNILSTYFHQIGAAATPGRERFRELLQADDALARADAARGLAGFAPSAPDIVDDLVGVLGDPNTSVRMEAIKALGAMGSAATSAIPALEAAKAKGPGNVSYQVDRALKKIRGE